MPEGWDRRADQGDEESDGGERGGGDGGGADEGRDAEAEAARSELQAAEGISAGRDDGESSMEAAARLA